MWFRKKRIDINATAAGGIVLTTEELHSLSWDEFNALRCSRTCELHARMKRAHGDDPKEQTGEAQRLFRIFEYGTREAQMREAYYKQQLAQRAVDYPPYGDAAIRGVFVVGLLNYFAGAGWAVVGAVLMIFYGLERVNSATIDRKEQLATAEKDYQHAVQNYEEQEKKWTE